MLYPLFKRGKGSWRNQPHISTTDALALTLSLVHLLILFPPQKNNAANTTTYKRNNKDFKFTSFFIIKNHLQSSFVLRNVRFELANFQNEDKYYKASKPASTLQDMGQILVVEEISEQKKSIRLLTTRRGETKRTHRTFFIYCWLR